MEEALERAAEHTIVRKARARPEIGNARRAPRLPGPLPVAEAIGAVPRDPEEAPRDRSLEAVVATVSALAGSDARRLQTRTSAVHTKATPS